MTADILRKKFLDFFASKNHRIIPSDSLVPRDDPTVLFTSAGMNQFKKQLMGQVTDFKRAATSQKCLRTGDLDNVGKTTGHHTFFEMLGNFSFGDYFKKEAIEWAWEFLTKELKISPEHLWISVYKDDREALNIWKDYIGIPANRIIKLGDKENFWPSEAKQKGPDGPCGPCSEIYFDYGADKGCKEKACDPSCSCGRFVEIWNLVFTQYYRREGGKLDGLPNKNIDTGMGLERLSAVIQSAASNFETDLFKPIVNEIVKHAKVEDFPHIYAVADHIRAVTFAISDGVMPSNEERGYVVRKLIRKAVLDLQAIGIKTKFLYTLVPIVCQVMKNPYPELSKMREDIAQVVMAEENSFLSILERVPQLFAEAFKNFDEGISIGTGNAAFLLQDTYGIPLEEIKKQAQQKGIRINMAEFNMALGQQKERSRKSSTMKGDVFAGITEKIDVAGTEFLGYETLEAESKVLKIFKAGKPVNSASESDEVGIVLDKTPFYPESGGQIGDKGFIINKDASVKLEVLDTQKLDQAIIHSGKVLKGTIKTADKVLAKVDLERRLSIARNHTATHLLQAALRKVLGAHIKQQGSYVADDGFRFDFTHFEKIKKDQLDRIQELVNEYIMKNFTVVKKNMSLAQAKESGALAFFAEKYSDQVRVVEIADISKELCGGTHLDFTGQAGLFIILSESSIAQGVRRIEATTGVNSYKLLKQKEDILLSASGFLGVGPDKIPTELSKLSANLKEAQKKSNELKMEVFKAKADDIISQAELVGDVKVISRTLEVASPEFLRLAADFLKDRSSKSVIALGSNLDGKVGLVMAISPELTKRNLDAGKIIKKIAGFLGGSGGGRAEFAQAGGTDAAKLDEALARLKDIIKEDLK